MQLKNQNFAWVLNNCFFWLNFKPNSHEKDYSFGDKSEKVGHVKNQKIAHLEGMIKTWIFSRDQV